MPADLISPDLASSTGGPPLLAVQQQTGEVRATRRHRHARGQLLGDEIGMLKLLIHQESHVILGVHIIGTGATELVHIGQGAIAFKATVEHFVNTVFNYPTLAECYKTAAFNALNKLRAV